MNNNKYIRSKENPGAVLNTDVQSLAAYKAAKKKNKLVEESAKRLDTLETQMSDIKDMLDIILQKLK